METLLSIPLWCDWDAGSALWVGTDWTTFQSHCGAIGTAYFFELFDPSVFFQSHCGAIGTGLALLAPMMIECFQSHCGAIGTPFISGNAIRGQLLSIPLWCDWDPTYGGDAT